jgi:hypothetical protein
MPNQTKRNPLGNEYDYNCKTIPANHADFMGPDGD